MSSFSLVVVLDGYSDIAQDAKISAILRCCLPARNQGVANRYRVGITLPLSGRQEAIAIERGLTAACPLEGLFRQSTVAFRKGITPRLPFWMPVDNAPEQPCLGSDVAHGAEAEPDLAGCQARRIVITMVFVPAPRAPEPVGAIQR